MKIWEVVNYWSESPDGLEARDVEGRYQVEVNAEAKLFSLASDLGRVINEGDSQFDSPTKGLFENYYSIEEHQTDD